MANAAEHNAGGTIPKGPNTSADGKGETTDLTKEFYRRMRESTLRRTKDKPSETPAENVPTATTTTNPPPATDKRSPEEIHAQRQRERLDAMYYAEIEAEAEKAIKDPTRKLKWNPDIGPKDKKWLEQREEFRKLLVHNSVSDVLDLEFEDAQKLRLIPPRESGPLLQVQLQNAEEYKAFFKPGARFHGVADNLATKLTMLKFGLPVEALTLKNVERCGNTVDETDPPDEPEPTPGVQRIMYAEKPLEFLDLYSERSFGYPMLRRSKRDNQQHPGLILPKSYVTGGNKPDPAAPTEDLPSGIKSAFNSHHQDRRPIFPKTSTLNVRGGAGSPEELFLDIPRYLYGNNDDMSLVNYDQSSSFVSALFTLFPTEAYVGETKTAWFFHIDVYRNHDKANKKKIFQRTVDIDQENFEQRWTGTIRHLLFNDSHDWILRVQIARPMNALLAPKTFEVPSSGTKLGSKPYVHWEEVKSKKSKNNTAKTKNTPVNWASGYKISQLSNIASYIAGKQAATANNMKTTNGTKTDKPVNVGSKKPTQPAGTANNMKATNGTKPVKPVDVGSKKPTNPTRTADRAKGTVYGYCGKLEDVQNTPESLLRAALLLTGQYPASRTKPTWTFDVDVPTQGSGQKFSVFIAPANWQSVLSKFILPQLKAGQPWDVFVRRGGKVSTELEPSSSTRDIIRITREGRGTAYWRVPSNQTTLLNCGINQIQPEFVRAMRLLCHEEPRSKHNLFIDNYSLGVDGLECVDSKFWGLVKDDLSKKLVSPEYSIQFRSKKASPEDAALINIRMVGNNYVSTVSSGNYMELAEEIKNISVSCLNDSELPGSFRIWENAQARERNGHSAVIKCGSTEEMSEALKTCYESWPQSHTLWFRPEWELFYLQDTDEPSRIRPWDSCKDQSLQSFKQVLKTFWSGFMAHQSFCITEVPSVDGRDIRFIVNRHTTEEDWRLYVFDWLHTKRLSVKGDVRVDYKLDTTIQWGLLPSVQPQTPTTTATSPQSRPAAKPTASVRTTTSTHPQFNKVRIVKRTASKVKTPKYATWLANEGYQDSLKLQSYFKDQPAVIPGKLPAAPIYGPSRDLQIKVSSSFPTVYAQRITPSDIAELIEENQTLRNKVLERMWACPICNVSFKNYNNTSIREHVQEHIQQMQEVAQCPMCGSADWGFMSMNQKRDHFQWHMDKENTIAMREQWRNIQCPACDKSLSNMEPEAIVDHCIKHRPDMIRYCDTCGLHEAICTKEELAHHQQVCRQAPERTDNDPIPVFCESCGKDTSNQTQIQMFLHERDCQNKSTVSSKAFCTQCGLDTTNFNNMELAGHTVRCKVPRGIKRKFCGRCATEFIGSSNNPKNFQHECRPDRLPTPPPEVEEATVFEKAERPQAYNFAPNSHFTAPNKPVGQDKEHNVKPTNLDALGNCPIQGCNYIIGTRTREAMFNHFKGHSDIGAQNVSGPQTTFKCPITDHEGQRCNQIPNIDRNNGTDIKFHYCHKGTIEEQAQVKAIGKGVGTPNTATTKPVETYTYQDLNNMPGIKTVFTASVPPEATHKPTDVKFSSDEDDLALKPTAKAPKTPKAPAKKRKQGEAEESTKTGNQPASILSNKKQKKASSQKVQFASRPVTRSTSGTPTPQ